MPVYDYDCAACGRRFEVIHGVHADPPASCPLCGSGPVRKAIAAPTIHFKGSGWAKKERRAGTRVGAGAETSGEGSGGEGSGGEGSSSDGVGAGAADASGDGSSDPSSASTSGSTSKPTGSSSTGSSSTKADRPSAD